MSDKQAPLNTHLYHYTKLEIAIEKILPKFQLKMGLLSDTNDPRESKEWSFSPKDGYIGPITIKYDEAPTPEFLHQLSHREISNGVKKGCKVICLSMDKICDFKKNDYGKGYCSSRMWAQYADNHRGVCLILNRRKLKDIANKTLKSKGLLFMGKVKYDWNLKKSWIFYFDSHEFYETNNKEEFFNKMVRENYKDYFFTKSDDWRQEKEYRIVLKDTNKPNEPEYLFIKECLEGVILGVDCPHVYDPLVEQICNHLKIPCRRMVWQNGHPASRMIENGL